jgi:two-component system, OmpR family, alkaline phosphatase synthesis response regulator PhoP
MRDHKSSQAGEPADAKAVCRAAPSNCILVVDDDPDVRRSIADVLLCSDYQVDTAIDGEAGWAALQTRNYDLLITDHKMPKVSGLELLMRLRSARMTLPVILASGALPEELNRLPWLQLSATLLKPFAPSELLGTVKNVLRATNHAVGLIEHLPIRRSQPVADALALR